MTDDELSRVLKEALAEDPAREAAHRAELEASLLEAYERRVPAGRTARPGWLRYASAAVVLLCLVTATQVPASYPVEVGKRVSLVLGEDHAAPQELGEQVAQALRVQGARVVHVDLRRMRRVDGNRVDGDSSVVQVDVWGDALATDAEALARLRALPQLAQAQVGVERLEGRVPDTLLGAVRHRWLRAGASPEEREAARVRLIEELRRVEGEDAQVDVQVDEDSGKQRVRVKVQRRVRE